MIRHSASPLYTHPGPEAPLIAVVVDFICGQFSYLAFGCRVRYLGPASNSAAVARLGFSHAHSRSSHPLRHMCATSPGARTIARELLMPHLLYDPCSPRLREPPFYRCLPRVHTTAACSLLGVWQTSNSECKGCSWNKSRKAHRKHREWMECFHGRKVSEAEAGSRRVTGLPGARARARRDNMSLIFESSGIQAFRWRN